MTREVIETIVLGFAVVAVTVCLGWIGICAIQGVLGNDDGGDVGCVRAIITTMALIALLGISYGIGKMLVSP